MSKSELFRLAIQRGKSLPDDGRREELITEKVVRLTKEIEQLNARVAMLSEAIEEIWYSNSTPIAETKYHEVINATEADVTKFINGVKAERDAEWMKEGEISRLKRVVASYSLALNAARDNELKCSQKLDELNAKVAMMLEAIEEIWIPRSY